MTPVFPPQLTPLTAHTAPTTLFNAMISPLAGYGMRGAIWYQGESNHAEPLYPEKKEALVTGWREKWGLGDFPFYFVQIAPYAGYGPGALPPLWEGQVASLKIPGTGMAVTTDLVDNIKDIHPKNKLDVGNRLALWALAKVYGQKNLVYSGPLYKGASFDGGKATITFNHVGSGLAVRDSKPLTHFQIAGDDRVFVPAKAEIVGDTVVVESATVTKPVAVRFGWDQTAEPNLMNKEGLPASPFRTDKWEKK